MAAALTDIRHGASGRGFTLVEAVVVIAITGIVAAAAAAFIAGPVQGYVDTTRRAQITDIADTALRRISRDLHGALPNSVRLTSNGATFYLEFLQTSGGGRYRAQVDNAGNGDILDFTQPDASFDVLGPAVTAAAGNLVVVFNLGIPGSDAYSGDDSSAVTGGAGNNIQINPKQFPFASPGSRFLVVTGPVSYVCDPVAGTLTRYWNYGIQAAQPTAFAGASSALLADHVSNCTFTYNTSAVTQRTGLVAMWLQLSARGENVNLYQGAHVSNVP